MSDGGFSAVGAGEQAESPMPAGYGSLDEGYPPSGDPDGPSRGRAGRSARRRRESDPTGIEGGRPDDEAFPGADPSVRPWARRARQVPAASASSPAPTRDPQPAPAAAPDPGAPAAASAAPGFPEARPGRPHADGPPAGERARTAAGRVAQGAYPPVTERRQSRRPPEGPEGPVGGPGGRSGVVSTGAAGPAAPGALDPGRGAPVPSGRRRSGPVRPGGPDDGAATRTVASQALRYDDAEIEEGPVRGRRRPRQKVRVVRGVRSRRLVRRIDVWTVLKVSFVFYLLALVVLVVAGIIVWNVAVAFGFITTIEKSVRTLFSLKSFTLHPGPTLAYLTAIGGVLSIVGVIVNVLAAVTYNLISDVVGGLQVVVVTETD